jgi:predicted nucleic acid-binding protein
MAVVVDASAIGAIMFNEPDAAELTAQLAGQTLIAPDLLNFELLNLALKKARRQPQLGPQITQALAAALRLAIARVAVPGIELFQLASATGLTAYDASYLWLALSRDIELVTLDRALARAAADRRPR